MWLQIGGKRVEIGWLPTLQLGSLTHRREDPHTLSPLQKAVTQLPHWLHSSEVGQGLVPSAQSLPLLAGVRARDPTVLSQICLLHFKAVPETLPSRGDLRAKWPLNL